MNTVIQVTTISGAIIESAKWTVEFGLSPSESHEISLNFDTNDLHLIHFLNKIERRGILLDGDKTEGYTISIKCDIKVVKHMVDITNLSTTSLLIVTPNNRTSEQVLLYLLDPAQCSLNFLKSVRT